MLLGLDGFAVLAAAEVGGEGELLVETTATLVGCPDCGVVAVAKDRRAVTVQDLPVGDRDVAGGPAPGSVDRAGPRVGVRRGRPEGPQHR